MRREPERLRDILEAEYPVHHYFDIDAEAVWAVVERDLPDLKHTVRAILDQLPPDL